MIKIRVWRLCHTLKNYVGPATNLIDACIQQIVNDYFGNDRHPRSSAWLWFTEYKSKWRRKGTAQLEFHNTIKKTSTMMGRWFINKRFKDLGAAFLVKLYGMF